MKRAIEESFPIVEVNRLAVPERNAFKPIYQMHKWFARRASSVFRAILLASMKPAGTDIMKEFYKDHTDDPDTNGVRVLDPFMGGGTTVIEALRLGCDVTGIDLNPVAWFIVKTEAEQVDIDELKDSFKRLEERITHSGKPLKEELLSHYKTECPCCGTGTEEADIIYTFWVKSAICTNPECKKEVPLFRDYVITKKAPSVKYVPDLKCKECNKEFDLDLEPAFLIAETSLSVNSTIDSSGDKRSNKRWALLDRETHKTDCPWCKKENYITSVGTLEKKKKNVLLNILLCPHCYSVSQFRGTLPNEVSCPSCKKQYAPHVGNISGRGEFLCSSCGNKDKVIESAARQPDGKLLPLKPYAIQGYCPKCAGVKKSFFNNVTNDASDVDHKCNINSNNGKFTKRISPNDLTRYNAVTSIWEKLKDTLSYPKQEVPYGEKTKTHLIKHHYSHWYKIFNPRQIYSLCMMLQAIQEENNQVLKELLLTAFLQTLRNNNMLCFYNLGADKLEPMFSRHDFSPLNTAVENNIWGTKYGRGTFSSVISKVIKGKENGLRPNDKGQDVSIHGEYRDPVSGNFELYAQSSSNMDNITDKFDCIITDPPYAGNVNYSELSDFFYVWLRLVLSKQYAIFSPESTPKAEEIIENPTRGLSLDDFQKGLTDVFKNSCKLLNEDGVLAFTFHHAEGSAWEAVLTSLCDSGFLIEAVYPIHGDAIKGGKMGAQLISYDLIHVCKKRTGNGNKRSWASIRQEIRKKARNEIKLIEAGRYGEEKLASADINIVLIGKCLELYSKHYGTIVDYKDEVVPLKDALASIRMMVEQLITTQQPLPSELEHIDTISYVYLTCLCDRKEIKSDEVHKATRGILEIPELSKAGVMRKGRAGRGRTYEVKTPDERYKDLEGLFKRKSAVIQQGTLFPEMEEGKFDNVTLVDIIHYLMGLAHESEDIVPWIREFEPVMPQVRIAMEYLREKNPTFQEPISRVLSLIEV